LNSSPKPPIIFIYVSTLSLLVSIFLIWFSGDISFDWRIFIKSNSPLLSFLGYVLSPFVPILCLAFLRNKDNEYRSNIYYDIGRGRLLIKIASLIAFASFIVGVLHIVRIAFFLQALL